MGKTATIFAKLGVAVAITLATLTLSGPIQADNGGLASLRGPASVDDSLEAADVAKQDRSKSAFTRAYRQQPPLVPHKIDSYQIDLKVNQCMGCHDWPKNVDVGAPKISETHYRTRDNIAIDEVSRSRWFCNQCHVPQVDAKELVKNTFKNANDAE